MTQSSRDRNRRGPGFARILELQKHLGQLSEGKNAWLKQEPEGPDSPRLCPGHQYGTHGAHAPNLAQVPSAHEYRELFYLAPIVLSWALTLRSGAPVPCSLFHLE